MSGLIQGTPEWLEWRKKGIGSSDISAIMGVSPYSTPYMVWSEKVGLTQGFAGNFVTLRGNELEDRARKRYELISMDDMPPACAVHPKYDILRVSLDGLRADNKKILEIKVPGRDAHNNALSGKVPPYYVPQVQLQLLVTGADLCDYFSFQHVTSTHALVQVEPNLEIQAQIVIVAMKFWELVVNKTPPPLTDDDDKIITDGEVFELCAKLKAGKDTLAKKLLDSMKAEVIRLGGHSRVRAGPVLVTKRGDVFRLTVAKEEAVPT